MGEKDRWPGTGQSGKPKAEGAGTVQRPCSSRMTRATLASALVAVVALGAGAASAGTRGSHGQVPGCHPTSSGRLKTADRQSGASCSNEKHLYTARVGNETHLYIARFNVLVLPWTNVVPWTKVVVLEHVPAGTYLVSVAGQADAYDEPNYPEVLECRLDPSDASYVPYGLIVRSNGPGSFGAAGDSVLTYGGTITFSCRQLTDEKGSRTRLLGVITAISVGGVN
jgi:hypothetical protein